MPTQCTCANPAIRPGEYVCIDCGGVARGPMRSDPKVLLLPPSNDRQGRVMSTGLSTRYLEAAGDDHSLAAALLAKALMRGEPAAFKAGYGRQDALISAREIFPEADLKHTVRILALIEPESPGEFPQQRFETQQREHAAWLDIGQEFRNRGIDINEGGWSTLIYAIRKWGEELHQLRLANPDHDDNALREARESYEGQYERGTYPEKIE